LFLIDVSESKKAKSAKQDSLPHHLLIPIYLPIKTVPKLYEATLIIVNCIMGLPYPKIGFPMSDYRYWNL